MNKTEFGKRIVDLYNKAEKMQGIELAKKPFVFVLAMPMHTWTNRILATSDQNKREPHMFFRAMTTVSDASIPFYLMEDTETLLRHGIQFGQVKLRRDRSGHPVIRFKAYLVEDVTVNPEPQLEYYAECWSKSYSPAYQVPWEQLYDDLKLMDILNEFEIMLDMCENIIDTTPDRDDVDTTAMSVIVTGAKKMQLN